MDNLRNPLHKQLEKIHKVQEDDYPRYRFTLIVIGVLVLILLGYYRFDGFTSDFYMEILSVILTVGLIDTLVKQEEHKRNKQIKHTHLWNSGKSKPSTEAKHIFTQMMNEDLLSKKITTHFNLREIEVSGFPLKYASLIHFNLTKSNWENIDFRNSSLSWSRLDDANFYNCLLTNATISNNNGQRLFFQNTSLSKSRIKSDFHFSRFLRVSFEQANISESSFEGGFFNSCDFSGCNLKDVNLKNANIAYNCQFDRHSILPDGKTYRPELGHKQLEKFTNPIDSEFIEIRPKNPIPYEALSDDETNIASRLIKIISELEDIKSRL